MSFKENLKYLTDFVRQRGRDTQVADSKMENRTDFPILHPCLWANDYLAPLKSEIIVTILSLF